ncbi:MAG TPA: DUF547 domain-containing protein, partial [Candidatus Krumholzibacteria bacterium]|nr:DUF547 domain-containing protein [Candidatus Krumholzibacteria bacterium]
PARADIYPAHTGLLMDVVDESGLVDYRELRDNPGQLDPSARTLISLVKEIAAQDPAAYEVWTENERLAFWLNTYNVLTLKLIVDHYPIQPATGRQKYPANSIQQIPNAWTGVRFKVMGTERTLDEIEHKIIRAQFKEPRVHFALVCAAMSCPPLRREPYAGEKLDAQLEDQARRFFADLRNLHVDREKNEVWVSRLIQWFADDFAPDAAQQDPRDVAERKAVLAAVTPYVDTETKAYLETATYTLHFFEYDWTLNEQAK